MKKYFEELKQAFLEEFSSVRLAITLFVFIAVTTLIGTILPEEPMVGALELIKKYGKEKYLFLKSLGLTDVFHSWWYLALLTSLGLNLTIASIRRVFPRAKKAFEWPPELKEESIKKLPINCEIKDLKLDIINQKLKEKNYKIRTNNNSIIAIKGAWHRLGASVTHVGILTLLVGSSISILTGFNGMTQISENEGFYLADLGQTSTQVMSVEQENWLAPISKMPIWFGRVPSYLVKVNKTWREDYKTGEPKQWYSDLSVLDQNKKEVARKTIHVNDPLEFNGLDIYQSNWGRFAQISFNNESITIPLEKFRGEELAILPISNDIGLKLVVNDLHIKDQSKNIVDKLNIYSVSLNNNNFQKLLGTIEKDKKIQLGPINIGYFGTQTLTGLQFKSNPGNFLIYPGFLFIILGVFIAFGSKKQIWVTVNSNDNKIIIGGNADRAKGKFFEEFENIISDLSNLSK